MTKRYSGRNRINYPGEKAPDFDFMIWKTQPQFVPNERLQAPIL